MMTSDDAMKGDSAGGPPMSVLTEASGLTGMPPMRPQDYLRIIALNKWLIGLVGVASALIGLLLASLLQPEYRSTATLLIEPGVARATASSPDELYFPGTFGREHFQSQLEILRSREIAKRVLDRLGLEPEMLEEAQSSSWRFLLNRLTGLLHLDLTDLASPRQTLPAADADDPAVRLFASRLHVDPVRLSNVINISFTFSNPQVAASVANEVAKAYIEADIQNRVLLSRNSGQWISDRLARIKAELDASEQAMQDYRDREQLLDSKSMVLGGAGRQLDEVTHRLVEARVRRSEAEEAYLQLRRSKDGNFESSPAVVRNAGVQRARSVEADAERRLAEYSQQYGSAHPLFLNARADFEAARASTERQILTIVNSITKEYQAAVGLEKALDEELTQRQAAIRALNRKEMGIGPLERDVATIRAVYQAFLTRQKENNAVGDGVAPGARLVDQAPVSTSPVWPRKKLVMIAFAAFGMILAALFALYRFATNERICREEDVESRLRVPLLTSTPLIRHGQSPVATLLKSPRHPYNEGVQVALTTLLLTAAPTRKHVFAVTSAVAGEGKSTFLLLLGNALARGRSTIVVECDFRRPSFSTHVPDLKPGEGSIGRYGPNNAAILPAVDRPDDPLQFLSSSAFIEQLEALKRCYDVVLLDCPPVHPVADTLVISRLADAVVFIVRSDSTGVSTVASAIRKLQRNGANVVGAVLSQHDHKRARQYYGEYNGAEKGYSYHAV